MLVGYRKVSANRKMASDQPSWGAWEGLSKFQIGFTECPGSKIGIHFWLSEYPGSEIGIHFLLH